MLKYGFSNAEGPLAAMKKEHNEGREHMRVLAMLASQSEPWTKEVCREVCARATNYVTLLRNHIDKEDNILNPIAETRLPQAAWDEIACAFANIDEENECSGMREENQALADLLMVH